MFETIWNDLKAHGIESVADSSIAIGVPAIIKPRKSEGTPE